MVHCQHRQFLAARPIVPRSPRALAETLAPLARLLRHAVEAALRDEESALATLRAEWSDVFFPDADAARFADAYAQTVTYALLLARVEGETDLRARAADRLDARHDLLAQVLRVLAQPAARAEVDVPVPLLERAIGAVDPAALARRTRACDIWLYFYEDFLAAYDSRLRRQSGVYYTPVEVVEAQVTLVAELLRERFDLELGFADPSVVVLDPATGTGTYLLAALESGAETAELAFGPAARADRTTVMARNLHGFELLVGAYAVAQLRLAQRVIANGGEIPKVFETGERRGIVSLITASSYLRGPGFTGMRKLMRQLFDELWILDLGGEGRGARRSENVFAIQTPVAIAIGYRADSGSARTPARVRYARIDGTRVEKLARLASIRSLDDVDWRDCFDGWTEPLLPVGEGDYFGWPALTDLFPWQHSGVQFERTWPIAPTPGLLSERFVPEGHRAGRVPQGAARYLRPIPQTAAGYPEHHSYDPVTRELRVGEGAFGPVAPGVRAYEVSGLDVIGSWLDYRLRDGAGRRSSPLDDVRPSVWPETFTTELLELLWVLERTVALGPQLDDVLEAVVAGPTIPSVDLPEPTGEERKPPS